MFATLRFRVLESGYPPPPPVSGIITLAGNSPQNPDVKELRGQNLDNKGLRGSMMWVLPTVTASTMIAQVWCWAQG